MNPNGAVDFYYLSQTKVAVATAFAWVAAVASWEWTNHLLAPGWFMVILLAFMTIEMVTKFWKSPKGGGEFPWEENVKQKILLILLVIVGFLLDMVVIVLMRWIPELIGIETDWTGPWGKGYLIVTVGTQLWLATAEGSRIVDNIAHSAGEENIPPVILWVIRQLRRADHVRYAKSSDGADGKLPPRRWYDDLTEEDVRVMLRQMDERRNLEPPPPPMDHGEGPTDTKLPGEG